MKKILFVIIPILIVIGIALVLVLINPFEKKSSDSIKFKEEYESLNNTVNESNNKKYRSISISKNNPFKYKEAEDIADMIENGETFVVYFGYNSCPWCRSVLPTLIEVAKDLKIDTIYYVDVKNIRDTIVLNDNGTLETIKEGTDGYYRLIKLLDNVLSDYTLTDSNGDIVSAKEGRIYAPNIVKVVDGKAVGLTTGVSESQNDGYMELTSEMINETYSKFEDILK